MMTDITEGGGDGNSANNDDDLNSAMDTAMAFLESEDSTSLDRTIQTMAATALCVHPEHSHSFSKVSFTLAASLRKCAGCSQPLKSRSLFGGGGGEGNNGDIVKCVACSALAHRFCALSPESPWKDECPVNGKLVQRVAEAMIVTDEEEEEEEEVDFEVGLQDHENTSNRKRINSSVSNMSGASMESQELDLHEDEEILKQEQEELMNMKREMGLLDDKMKNNLDNTLESDNPQKDSSPAKSRPPILSNFLRTVKGETQGENAAETTDAETAIGDSKNNINPPMKDQNESEHQENDGDREDTSEVANSSARPWLSLRNLKAKPDTEQGPEEELKDDNDHSEGDGPDLDTCNNASNSNRRGSWFQRPRKQDLNTEEDLEPPAECTTTENPEKPPSRFNIFAKKRIQNNQVIPKKSETPNNADEFQDANTDEENESAAAEEQFSMFLNVDDDEEEHIEEDNTDNFQDAVQEEREGEIAKDDEPCLIKSVEQEDGVTNKCGDMDQTTFEDTLVQEDDEILDNSQTVSQDRQTISNTRFSIFRRNKSADDADRPEVQDEHDEEIVSFEKSRSLDDDGTSPSADDGNLFGTFSNNPVFEVEDDESALLDTIEHLEEISALQNDNGEDTIRAEIANPPTTPTSSRSVLQMIAGKANIETASADLEQNESAETEGSQSTSSPMKRSLIRNPFRKAEEQGEDQATASESMKTMEEASAISCNQGHGEEPMTPTSSRLRISNIFQRNKEMTVDALEDAKSEELENNNSSRKGEHQDTCEEQEEERTRDKLKEDTEDESAKTSILSRVFNTAKTDEDEKVEEGAVPVDEKEKETKDGPEKSTSLFSFFSKKDVNESGDAAAADATSNNVEGEEEQIYASEEPELTASTTPSRFSLFSSFRRTVKESQVSGAPNPDLAQAWTSDSPPSHWATATTASFHSSDIEAGESGSDEDKDQDLETPTEPLHYANHPFASVSRALQDNVLTLFGRSEEEEQPGAEQPEAVESERCSLKPKSTLSWIVSPEPPKSPSEPEVDVKRALSEIKPEPVNESTLKKLASGTYQTVKAVTSAQQKMGMASVAGGIAGGVAGLMFAGPAGAVMGVRYGQTAGMLGVVLEGSLTVGVVVAGVAGGRFTAEKIQEQMKEQRVLTIGERGVSRKVMLVRPAIRIDPAWHEICAQAQRTSPSSSTSAFSFNLFSGTDNIKHDRYEKTSDIVETEEDEIPTGEKVLLLVSRVLSDKDSFPGHVYRCLMQAFRERCEMRENLIKEKKEFPHLFETSQEDSVNMGDGVSVSVSTRARREDAHGVIKYITATLLEVRPGLASTPEITEMTASVVEALVFGEVYDLVYEEIAMEATEKDKKLIEKIDNFEYERFERIGIPLATEGLISKPAIDELRRLPELHSAVDKLRHCVSFLEMISEHFAAASKAGSVMGADSLLKMVCQHIIAAKMSNINAEVAFLEEFARDEQLLRGKEGYALVTLQASLHFLNMSVDFERDIFGQENDEENIPLVKAQEPSSDIYEEVTSDTVGHAQVDGGSTTVLDAEESTTKDSNPPPQQEVDLLNGEEKGEVTNCNNQDLI